MKTRLPRLLLTLTLLAPSMSAQTSARRAAGGAETVVFSVSKTEAGASLEPVVIYRRGVLVGSFSVENKTGQYAGVAYALFMIFEPGVGGFKPALTWFHRAAAEETEERDFVDQVDLDGDGVAEVIAEGFYPESNDYVIYKKRQGHWVSVYQGGSGSC